MPALVPTDVLGRIVWLGVVADRDASLRSDAVQSLMARFDGIPGEDHSGLTRASCSRVTSQYPRGTTIRNTRQLSIVSAEELREIALEMDVSEVHPEWIGATMVVDGIPDFSHVPPSSRLQSGSGTTLTVDMQNRPCHLPAPVIEVDEVGKGHAFKSAAKGRRGVTAWVEREGPLTVGDAFRLHIPEQRVWSPALT